MSPYLLGIDAGGTTIRLRQSDPDRATRRDTVFESADWTSLPAGGKALVLAELIRSLDRTLPLAVGIGAHGCDTEEECRELEDAIRAALPGPAVRVVNDAFLLPLAGSDKAAAGVVIGTGSIAVAETPEGHPLHAGGWGWLFGDPGSAWGTVREAVAQLARLDDEGVDIDADPLMLALRSVAGVVPLRSVVEVMQGRPAYEWARWSPIVFRAAHEGSRAARRAVEVGAQSLTRLVGDLIARGGAVEEVVASGGVITNQPLLAGAFAAALRRELGLEMRILDGDAVEGAVTLAARLHELQSA